VGTVDADRNALRGERLAHGSVTAPKYLDPMVGRAVAKNEVAGAYLEAVGAWKERSNVRRDVVLDGLDELRIELKGNVTAMLSASTNAKRSPVTGDLSLQVSLPS
jgi:hypothetical protein